MKTRRVLVQRWPAVPTAPNTIAGIASFRSAVSSTIIALLPPSSSSERPMRLATRSPTWRPTLVEPVKLTRPMRLSSTKVWASSVPASLNRKKMSGKPHFFSASFQIFIEAIAANGVLGEGFQMQMSPQAADTKAVQAQHVAGKLNAEKNQTMQNGGQHMSTRGAGNTGGMVG